MKFLVISDSHLYNTYLLRVIKKHKNSVDYVIHCGDSSLEINDPLLKSIDIIVLGNHDTAEFEEHIIFNSIFITHGHLYNVYKNYSQLINQCKANHCNVCFHGHTHVPTHQIHDGIHFINPGSLMMNRGSYGYGTYALVEYDNQTLSVSFYNHSNDQLCSENILIEGIELLEEFKKLV